jgi:hypothetical protein
MRRSAICVTLPFMRLMLVTALLLSASASADLRCDTDLVSRGMTSFEVLERCGAPVYETAFVDVRHPGVFVYVDEWLYDLGSNRTSTVRASNCSERLRTKRGQNSRRGSVSCRFDIIWQPLHTPRAKAVLAGEERWNCVAGTRR